MEHLHQPVTNSPTVIAVVIATAILSTTVGYFMSLGSSLAISRDAPAAGVKREAEDDDDHGEWSSAKKIKTEKVDEPEIGGVRGDYKMMLLVRTDLGMTKGKIAAQCGHATLACYKALQKKKPSLLRRWEQNGQAKVAVKVSSEEQMDQLYTQAVHQGLTAEKIVDAGRTQVVAGSVTVMGIGPAQKEIIDRLTGHLKLL